MIWKFSKYSNVIVVIWDMLALLSLLILTKQQAATTFQTWLTFICEIYQPINVRDVMRCIEWRHVREPMRSMTVLLSPNSTNCICDKTQATHFYCFVLTEIPRWTIDLLWITCQTITCFYSFFFILNIVTLPFFSSNFKY